MALGIWLPMVGTATNEGVALAYAQQGNGPVSLISRLKNND
jgi:hypothetical protein